MRHFAQIVIALVAITNPLGAMPVFLSLVGGLDAAGRRAAARRTALAVGAILTVSVGGGEAILGLFGISLPAFQAGGGLLIVLMGIEMLRGAPSKLQDEREREENVQDSLMVPLAMPIIAGPGSIATVIAFTARAKGWREDVEIAAAIWIVAVAVFVVLASAGTLSQRISARGLRIFGRFMGLILVAVGAQLLLSGVTSFQRSQ